MLLAIAAANSQLTLNESPLPSIGMNGFAVSNSRNTNTSIADQAKGLFFEGGGRPVSIDRGGYGSEFFFVSLDRKCEIDERLNQAVPQGQTSDSKIIFSGRHEGLAFYFARIIRPIWKMKITRPAPSPTNPGRQTSFLPDTVLSAVQHDLMSLRTFIEQ